MNHGLAARPRSSNRSRATRFTDEGDLTMKRTYQPALLVFCAVVILLSGGALFADSAGAQFPFSLANDSPPAALRQAVASSPPATASITPTASITSTPPPPSPTPVC